MFKSIVINTTMSADTLTNLASRKRERRIMTASQVLCLSCIWIELNLRWMMATMRSISLGEMGRVRDCSLSKFITWLVNSLQAWTKEREMGVEWCYKSKTKIVSDLHVGIRYNSAHHAFTLQALERHLEIHFILESVIFNSLKWIKPIKAIFDHLQFSLRSLKDFRALKIAGLNPKLVYKRYDVGSLSLLSLFFTRQT